MRTWCAITHRDAVQCIISHRDVGAVDSALDICFAYSAFNSLANKYFFLFFHEKLEFFLARLFKRMFWIGVFSSSSIAAKLHVYFESGANFFVTS